jgi:Skp family chaperone for outer membrane proteins
MKKIGLPLIVLAGIVLILSFVASSKSTGEENNAYIRVINCIVSYPATQRTQTNIEECYKTVEDQMHVHLQRYDSSNK